MQKQTEFNLLSLATGTQELPDYLVEIGNQSNIASLQTAASSNSDTLGRDLEIAVRVDTVRELTQIDLTKVHCTKTGQPIASRDSETLAKLMSFFNATRMEEIAHEIDLASGIDPRWVHTGPDNLNKLQHLDPRGFFTYCIGTALIAHHTTYIGNKEKGTYTKQFETVEKQRAFRNSLVRCWYATAQFSEDELRIANKHLRFFMYLDLHNKKYYRVPWQMVRAHRINEFEAIIAASQQKIRPIGKFGNDGVLIDPKMDNKLSDAIQISILNEQNRALWQHGLEAQAHIESKLYNNQHDPLMPHEFATSHGVAWIKFVLMRTLEKLEIKMRHDAITYKNLHAASAFRSGSKYKGDLQELDEFIGDLGAQGIHDSLRALVERSKQLTKSKQKPTPSLSAFDTLELNVSVVNNEIVATTGEQKPIDMKATIKIPTIIKIERIV